MSSDSSFDDTIEQLGGFGRYHKRLLYLLLGPLFFIMPFPLLHQVFVLHVPDHSCVPPEHLSNDSLMVDYDLWQELVLPTVLLPSHEEGPSTCNYFNYTQDQVNTIIYMAPNLTDMTSEDREIFVTSLQNVTNQAACTEWEYDQSEFTDTLVTEKNWVCEKSMYTADLYTLAIVGLILGTFVFSLIADFYGRKTSFYVGAASVVVLTLCMIPGSENINLFAFLKVAAAFGMLPLFQSPLSILCEISNIDKRGYVLCYGCITWSLGQCVFPLVGYIIASWRLIKAVSVLPLVLFFFTWKLLPESPRWMISKGKYKEATAILRKIAETNNVVPPPDLEQRIQKMSENNKEKSLGYLGLFSRRILGFRTILMTIGFTASAFVYYQMVINVSNMMGNTFLNLFLLGLVEGPGTMIGIFLANTIGRRWTHCTLLFMNAILFSSVTPLVYMTKQEWVPPVISFLCMFIKMNIAATFTVAYVQAMELFPTSLRQSGVGFCSLISQTISIGGPYVIALGMYDLKLPYLVMALICLVGAISTSCLPETVGAKLPDTIEDASLIGRSDKFFSFLPRKYEVPVEQDIIKKRSKV